MILHKWLERIGFIFIGTAVGLLMVLFLNNVFIMQLPPPQPERVVQTVMQVDESEEGQPIGNGFYYLSSFGGIDMFYRHDGENRVYKIINENDFPVCVMAKTLARKDIESSVFFAVPIYPGQERTFGIIKFGPGGAGVFTFRLVLDRAPYECAGEVAA